MEFGELPKLVRDKIPEIAEENDHDPRYYEAEQPEIRERILDKICEEALELREDGSIEELKDLLEVIEKYIQISDIDRETLEEMKSEKRSDRGRFEKNYVLESSDYSS